MEIHPAHGPVHTFKDFFVHLAIITVGILIALGLEGLVEWRHHRALAQEARQNLAAEVAHNKAIMEDWLPKVHHSQEQLKHIVEVMQQPESRRKSSPAELVYTIDFPSLYSGSWNAANRSGAINYMGYDEVEKYSDLYELQQDYNNFEHQALSTLTELGGLMPTILNKDLKKLPEKTLEEIERAANKSILIDQAIENIGKQLQEQYAKVPQQK